MVGFWARKAVSLGTSENPLTVFKLEADLQRDAETRVPARGKAP